MKKIATAAAALLLLFPTAVKTAVDNKLSSASEMHERLFVHYLEGSGETVNKNFFTSEEIQIVKAKCEEDVIARFLLALEEAGAGDTVRELEVQQTTYDEYGSPLNYSFGSYVCKADGARDVYDFLYAPSKIGKPINTPAFYMDVVGCWLSPIKRDLPRCIVTRGYGKPFDVEIKF